MLVSSFKPALQTTGKRMATYRNCNAKFGFHLQISFAVSQFRPTCVSPGSLGRLPLSTRCRRLWKRRRLSARQESFSLFSTRWSTRGLVVGWHCRLPTLRACSAPGRSVAVVVGTSGTSSMPSSRRRRRRCIMRPRLVTARTAWGCWQAVAVAKGAFKWRVVLVLLPSLPDLWRR